MKIGTVYHYWTVIGEGRASHPRQALCRCRCGVERCVAWGDLKQGKSTKCRSCSLRARAEMPNLKSRKHGLSDSPTQWVWSDMKRRCLSPHRRGYQNYGGRGITICTRWLEGDGENSGFACFLLDMGERPSRDHQLDRRDNDREYSPENCQWVPRRAQDYNKRNTFRLNFRGVSLTLLEAEAIADIPRNRIYTRVTQYGWPPEKAILTPIGGSRVRTE